MKNQIEETKESVIESVNSSVIKLPSQLIGFLPWKQGDGMTKYHYSNLPPGYQCGWSCFWLTAEGRITPLSWGISPDNMTRLELMAELLDTALQPGSYHKTKAAEYYILWKQGLLSENHDYAIRRFLVDIREQYKSYIYAGNPFKYGIQQRCDRPGWPVADYKLGIYS